VLKVYLVLNWLVQGFLHVPIMSGHNIMWSVDANCWLTTRGGKKVKRPFIFKLAQHHTNNSKPDILFPQCIVIPNVNVLPLGYGRIYNIIFDDKCYDVIIRNLLGYSCVYFVAMLASSLGGRGVYVQCKHLNHFLQSIMFYGLIKEFIHHCTRSWDEVQHLLKRSEAFEL
jgi:hypothetical protein